VTVVAPEAALAAESGRQRRLLLDRSIAACFGIACMLHVGLGAAGLLTGAAAFVFVELAAVDLERRIIPNRIVLPAAFIVLASRTILEPSRFLEWIVAGAATAVFLALPLLVRPDAVGLGDVKLGLLLGFTLGRLVPAALTIGLCAAGAVALLLVASRGRSVLKDAIPLGPFLAAGAILAILLSAPGALS
jgi:leader peptidase (prepilin peptidase) / N-methyltransferase